MPPRDRPCPGPRAEQARTHQQSSVEGRAHPHLRPRTRNPAPVPRGASCPDTSGRFLRPRNDCNPPSLGLALAGLAYTIGAGGGEATARGADAGYDLAMLFLAAAATLAAVIAALRGRSPLSHGPSLTAE